MRVLLLLLWLFGGWLAPMFSLAGALPDYQVKAVLIYKIIKFIEWPEQAFSDTTSSFDFCVIGVDPFGDSLDLIQGKQVRGRQLAIHKINRLASLPSQCQALFISSSEKNHLPAILDKLGSHPILTISDTKGFAGEGSIVNFVTKKNKIRFEINLDASHRAELKVSSQLLELAIIVGNNRK
ncbi:MAG: YfiR family protein [Gammaproteobacteria bacterium]|nr:YfiR family protein [Gammaproteobacteria bacterium]